jgi:hypothetical protein
VLEGSETIAGAASDTDGFKESWQNFKNYLKITLEPAAIAVFDNLEALVGELKPAADRVVEAFEKDGLEGALAQVAEEWDRIYKDKLQPLFIQFMAFLNDTIKPIALALGNEIGGAIASGMWSAFKAGVSNLFGSKMGERILGGDLSGFELAPAPGVDLSGLVPNFGGAGGTADFSSVRGGAGQAVSIMNMDLSNLSAQLANLPRMAAGGVVSGPTLAMIGEAGPEAVIPLDRMGSMGGNVINITVTSADPQAVVEALRRYTRANGPLGQVVSV